MDIPILYEDDEILVVDKPSGLVVNWAQTVQEETLQDWMKQRYPDIWAKYAVEDQRPVAKESPSRYRGSSATLTLEDQRYFVERVGLVHRLDKETSGVMVLAKSALSFVELLSQFRERLIYKEYLALTHGFWQVKVGEVNVPIGRRRDNRQKMGVREDGRESVTAYEVLREFAQANFPRELRVDTRGYQGFSLVRFVPKTGRTHQIRVHAKVVGHPLVGDAQYAGRKRSREDRKWCPRVALQAQKLAIWHPTKKTRMSWESRQVFDFARYLF